MPVNLKNQKEEKRAVLIRTLGVPKTTRAIVLSYIQDQKLQDFMLRACDAIGLKLLTEIDDLAREGADAFIVDVLDANIPLQELMQHAIVPIIPAEDSYQKYFSELKGTDPVDLYQFVLEEIETPLFRAVMEHCKYNQSRAAIMLGISRGTLRTKLRSYFDDKYVGSRD